MPVIYPIKVQVIRTKGQKERLYVGIPSAIAAAIGMEGGEEIEWELLDRGELHLVRKNVPEPTGTVKKTAGKK
jgi:hypothetical protein